MAEVSEKTTINLKARLFLTKKIKEIIPLLSTQKGFSLVLLVLAILFNAIVLWPEVSISTYSLNDEVLHLTAAQGASDALRNRTNPSDFWLPQIGLGFPLFHYYQHLPQLVLAVVNQVTSHFFSLAHLLDLSRYLLLVFFPLSIYWAMLRFNFDHLSAGFSALVSSLLATNGLYGFDYESYIWRGFGLYTQLWAMFFLPLALAEIYRTLKKDGSWFWSVLLSSVVLLSNLVYGYILVLSALLFVFLKPDKREILSRLKRFGINFGLTAVTTAYFFIPFLADRNFFNRSIWEEQFKYNSYGASEVLKQLFTGNLLDYGRVPVLSILLLVSVFFVAKKWRNESCRLAIVFTLLWLFLYFGRPTWGILLNILPFGQDLHLHRFIGGFHLGSIMLIGAGLSLLWQFIKKFSFKLSKFICPTLASVIFIVALLPVSFERINFYQQNSQWKSDTQKAFASENSEIADIKNTLGNLPPGRIYAGLATDFGKYPYYKIGSVPIYAVLQQLGFDTFGYAYYALPLSTDIRLHFDNTKIEQYDLFNIRYVLLHKTWTAPYYYLKLKEFNNYVLYEVSTTGYFDLVETPAVFYGNKTDFYSAGAKWLFSKLPALKQYPIIEVGSKPENGYSLPEYSFKDVNDEVLSKLTQETKTNDRGQVISEKISFNSYKVEVLATNNTVLLLKENYHPNLKAFVDGAEVKTFMLAPGYTGLKLSSGAHSVILLYQSQPLRLLLMILGILTLAFLALSHFSNNPLNKLIQWPNLKSIISFGVMKTNLKVKIGIYLLFLSVYLIFASGHFWSTDHISVYLTAQSLAEKHSFVIKQIHDTVAGKDGNPYSVFGLGQTFLSIPFYMLGKFVDNAGSPVVRKYFGGVNIGDWGGTVPIFFVSLFNQFVTPLICVLVFLFCLRLGFSRKASFLTTLVLGLSTAIWVSAHDYFQHSLETLLLLLSVYILYSNKENLRTKHILLAGVSLAFGIFTRVNLVLLTPVLLAYLILIERKKFETKTKIVKQAMWFSTPIFLILSLMLVLNNLRFGGFFLLHGNQGIVLANFLPALYGNLFSVGRSIFLYSPPILIGLFMFRKFYNLHREEALLFMAIPLTYLLSYSVYHYWDGGWSWGPRFLIPTLPYLIIPAALAFENKRLTAVTVILAGFGIFIQILGVVVNVSYVNWDIIRMNLNPGNAYLFVPEISPISMHFKALLAGRHVDLWLLEVYKQFGLGTFLITVTVPISVFVSAVLLLKKQ